MDLGKYLDAGPPLLKGLQISQSINDQRGSARILVLLAESEAKSSSPFVARHHAMEALDIAKGIRDQTVEIDALVQIGDIDRRLGNTDSALEVLNEALRESTDPWENAYIQNVIGQTWQMKGANENAERAYLEARRAASDFSDQRLLTDILSNLSKLYEQEGRHEEAVTAKTEASALRPAWRRSLPSAN
jgi:tetratricopeptide (TPR) repeat protein